MTNVDQFLRDNNEYAQNFGEKVRLVSLHQRPVTKPGPAGIALDHSCEEVGCSYLYGRPYGVGAVGLCTSRAVLIEIGSLVPLLLWASSRAMRMSFVMLGVPRE